MTQVVANGLVNGAILALFALSVTIIFSILRVPNFGLGGVFVWGAFLAYVVVVQLRMNFVVGAAVALVGAALLGLVVERFAFRRLRTASEEAMFVSAIGVLIIMENAAYLVWGGDTYSMPVAGLDFRVSLGGLAFLPATRVMLLVVATCAFAGLHLLIRRSRMGKAMRAVAQDRVAASLLGIPIDRVAATTFALGSGMAGLAGALVGATFSFTFEIDGLSGLKAFVAVVLGGLGSVLGAIAGGFILGLIDSFTQTYLTSEYKQVVAFGMLILVLAIRPAGLFGERGFRADAPRP